MSAAAPWAARGGSAVRSLLRRAVSGGCGIVTAPAVDEREMRY